MLRTIRASSRQAHCAGSYRKLALATIMLATVGVAFALLITAVELSKDDRQPVYDLNLKRGSPEYTLFLAVSFLLQCHCWAAAEKRSTTTGSLHP